MNQPNRKPDPAVKGRPYLEEADIGSGEKTPAQLETEQIISEIPALPPGGQQQDTSNSQQGGQQQPATQQEGNRQAVKP
jgi:hypothetical protein